MNKTIIVLLLGAMPLCAIAQQKWEISGGIGGSAYFGDLDYFPAQLGILNPAVTAQFGRLVTPHITVRAGFTATSLAGDEKKLIKPEWRRERGFSFVSPLVEANVVAEVSLLDRFTNQDDGRRTPNKFNPYILFGFGAAYHDPQIDWNLRASDYGRENLMSAIKADEKYGGNKVMPVFPMGMGFRVPLSSQTSIGVELTWRATLSDYLDGISQAANPTKNDWYMTGLFKVTRTLGQEDRDDDGVSDARDTCPDQPGNPLLGGCPDADGDGVADYMDQCPNQAGSISANGCVPAPKR